MTMMKYATCCMLALFLSTFYVAGLPAPPAEDSEAAEDVEIVKSEELPLEESNGSSYEPEKSEINNDPPAEQKYIQDEHQGARVMGIVQSVLQNILQPQPIVDTISEEDKYGNTGDSLGALGRGIVGGSEALSNFVNLAIEYPTNLFKSLAHRATEALNHLGSKLVGL